MSNLIVKVEHFEDLATLEQETSPNNGCGREYATHIRITHEGMEPMLVSDAMEPEDATFGRDLSWIVPTLRRCYGLGRAEAAWDAGMREGKTCASCGAPLCSDCPRCQKLWES